MAKKFRGPELVKEIDKQLDKAMAVFIFNTQSKLSAASPRANWSPSQQLVCWSKHA